MRKTAVAEPPAVEAVEKLVRLRATRRGATVDLLVHYEVSREHSCITYRIIMVDEA